MTSQQRTRSKRYKVHSDLRSPVGRTNSEPHRVVDTTTNSTIDQYSSKYAATMHARDLNRQDDERSAAAAVAESSTSSGRYVIACRVSGGATGTRESIVKSNGAIQYFDDEDAANQEATRLRSTMGQHSSTQFQYWVVPAESTR